MRKYLGLFIACDLIAGPVQARDLRDQAADVRPGTFIGAQLHVSLGGKHAGKARAAIGIAPTRSRISNDGMIRTSIGDGLALSFTGSGQPELTLAGTRADVALGLGPRGPTTPDGKLGVSTGGWIAIGVGTVALVAVGGLYLWAEHISYCEERDC